MKNMTLPEIAEAVCGELHYGSIGFDAKENKEVEGVVIDSRKCEKDYLFIATVGERVDGHSFIAQVMEKGAAAVVCEKVPECDCTYILVKDSFDALKKMAAWYRSHVSAKIVGIVGSVGKTSTKEFVASVLSARYSVLKTEGNLNNEIGMPQMLLKIRKEHDVAVIEMGISDFGEMERLAQIARPDMVVYTNIGQCHLENLKTREGILKAKTELLPYLPAHAPIVINGDDDMLLTLKDRPELHTVTYGRGEACAVTCYNEENRGLFGSVCEITDDAGSFLAQIPLPGSHMVLNALAATAVGRILGLTNEEIARGMQTCESVSGRSHILRADSCTVIDDCYNANPVSMKAAIDLLSTATTRKVAILGDMFELGAKEKELHAEVGAYAALKKVDLIIAIGSLSENMFTAASEGKEVTVLGDEMKTAEGVYWFANKAAFLSVVESDATMLRKDDTILVKASHGMEFPEIVKVLTDLKLS